MLRTFIQTTKYLLTLMLFIDLLTTKVIAIGGPYTPLTGESQGHYDNRVRQMEEQQKANDIANAEAHREVMRHNAAMVENARQTNVTCSGMLSRNRVYWYTMFAGFGCGILALTASGADDTGGSLAGFGMGGLAVGVAGGWALKKFSGLTEQMCSESRLLRIGGGLLTFVPYIIAGAIRDSKH